MKFKTVFCICLAQAALAAFAKAGEDPAPAPFLNSYHDRFVYKIFLKSRREKQSHCTMQQAMEIIRQNANLSLGMPQIVYLVGWNHEGHDSKYPDWGVVGPQCAYGGEADPASGLRRFIRDARQYGAKVSLHVNMDLALKDSPLWNEYVAQKCLLPNPDGSPHCFGIAGGQEFYHVSKVREWECGLATNRIAGLLKMLPELKESGTIHCDYFCQQVSPLLKTTREMETLAAKKILSFWRRQGVDVTTEYLPTRDFIGWIPMVLWLNLDESDRLACPPSVICGGGSSWNCRQENQIFPTPGKLNFYGYPAGGCLYEEAWGTNIGEDYSPGSPKSRAPRFYLENLVCHFLNRFRALELRETKDRYTVLFSEDVVSSIDTATRKRAITWRGVPLVEDGNVCVPVEWGRGGKNRYLFFSRDGGKVTFHLAGGKLAQAEGKIFRVSVEPPSPAGGVEIKEGTFTRTLSPGEAGCVEF